MIAFLLLTTMLLLAVRSDLDARRIPNPLVAWGALAALVCSMAPGGIGLALPLLTTRRVTTTVQLQDGQSFAIGGLIRDNLSQNIRALPVLGEVPVLGALFRSSDFQSDRSELVFIVTPRLVQPLPAEVRLPTDDYRPPGRAEFFLGGKMEGTPVPVPTAATMKD